MRKKMLEADVAAYYDTHSILPDYYAAKKNGTLIVTRPGESALDLVLRRRAEEKKNVQVSMRLPVAVANKAKEQAAAAGVPWTSYVRNIVERAITKSHTKTKRAATVAFN